MNLNYTINTNKILNLFFFIAVYFTNIASVEIFRLDYSMVVFSWTFLVLSIFSSLILLFSSDVSKKHYSIIYAYTFLVFIYFSISSIFGSPEYGLTKGYVGLIMPVTLVTFLGIKSWKQEDLLLYIIYATIAVSLVAIVYKIPSGFFNRSVNFGLFGSITFGWISSFGFLAAIIKRRLPLRYIYLTFFFLLIVWSGSKGPLLAIIITLLLYFKKHFLRYKLTVLLVILITSFLFLFTNLSEAFNDFFFDKNIRQVTTIIKLAANPSEYVYGEGYGSFGLRLEFFKETYRLFLKKPLMGYGFGGFAEIERFSHKYPHNVPLELLIEVGLLGIALVSLLIILIRKKSRIKWLGYYGMFALLTSGDFSYFRYGFFFILISSIVSNEDEDKHVFEDSKIADLERIKK